MVRLDGYQNTDQNVHGCLEAGCLLSDCHKPQKGCLRFAAKLGCR